MIGQFAFSKAGHDKDRLYVIVAQEGDFVYLCDGKGKTLAEPKKKRKKHIQPVNCRVEQELLNRLTEGAKVYPEEIRCAIRQYDLKRKKETQKEMQ